MGKALVIVESPSKSKIINKYLGDNYIVKASIGHIRDLPMSATKGSSGKKATLLEKIGLDPEHQWKADYQIMEGKGKVVAELKALAKEADDIYLATDLDREGEAIAWHLQEILKSKGKNFWRVTYPEITKSAIEKAFKNPGQINMSMVNAQQTRRFLDRIVGFMLSPLLWSKVASQLSAGRVQSVAVKLIVEREREIKDFKPQEYWTIDANTLNADHKPLSLSLTTYKGKKLEIHNEQEATALEEMIKSHDLQVKSVESKKGKLYAPPPFTTSTMQQAANQRLGFSAKRTMSVAQKLYESGFITYMRTDSVNLSQDAINAARTQIDARFGKSYVPESPNYFKSKEQAQEAHEAIRPSYADLTSAQLPSTIDRDGARLYQLIYDRYLACQMAAMEYETTSVLVNCNDYGLRASGRVILFDGFRKLYPSSDKEEMVLPAVKEGEILSLEAIDKNRHFTHPPARYTESSLIKELEKDGIGRPSTYASIIDTIQTRGYVNLESRRFFATKTGEIVTDRLQYSFANLMDTTFTASLEQNLDDIASGKVDWIKSLDDFYKDFSEHLEKAKLPADKGGMPDNKLNVIDMLCPQCKQHKLSVQMGKTGAFLACTGYWDKSVPVKERCHKTINLRAINVVGNMKNIDEAKEAEILRFKKRCPKCEAVMDEFLLDEHQKLHICSKAPSCDGYILEEGNFEDQIDRGITCVCDKCGSLMEQKEGRFGKYMLCTNEECKHTRKILASGEVAPPKEDPVDLPELLCEHEGSHFVLRDGAAGIFLAAHNFPKVRETRAPKVKELHRFIDRIADKFKYLALAPQEDDKGNDTEVRFSRKNKEQYIVSVDDKGKQTTWSAIYDSNTNSWNVLEKKTAAKKSTAKKTTRSKKS